MMKSSLIILFCLMAGVCTLGQTITAAEYFFDNDPGVGAASPMAIGTAASVVSFTATVPVTSLSPGMHTLSVRTKNSVNAWGLFESRTFYLSGAATNAEPIVAAEYFIDNDPGPGAGTGLGISTPGHVVHFNAVIPVASLAPGFHILGIRTRDQTGHWSLFENRTFYKSSIEIAASPINAAEYYIDNDPGVGLGTSVAVGAAGASTVFTAMVPVNSLPAGFHTLCLRARTADGQWGIVEHRSFYIQQVSGNLSKIATAEYFMDADPGIGNGTPLSIATPTDTVRQNFLLNIPAGTPDGVHVLAIRVKDENGIWSLFETREVQVTQGPLPLQLLSFDAQRVGRKVGLQWRTANEVNVSHFDVERSANGNIFSFIGKVPAKQLAANNYRLEDAEPLRGLNYYRLKQVDKDGSYKYSSIVKVYMADDAVNELRLFPQPVLTDVQVDFAGSGKEVFAQVYDAAGKMVMNSKRANSKPLRLSFSHLAAGTYWLVLSDGITIQKAKFVKQ